MDKLVKKALARIELGSKLERQVGSKKSLDATYEVIDLVQSLKKKKRVKFLADLILAGGLPKAVIKELVEKVILNSHPEVVKYMIKSMKGKKK